MTWTYNCGFLFLEIHFPQQVFSKDLSFVKTSLVSFSQSCRMSIFNPDENFSQQIYHKNAEMTTNIFTHTFFKNVQVHGVQLPNFTQHQKHICYSQIFYPNLDRFDICLPYPCHFATLDFSRKAQRLLGLFLGN